MSGRTMTEKQKIKIVTSKYHEEKDLIIWDVLFIDTGVEQAFCWPSIDLMKALNITAKVLPEQLHKFCSDIEGKTITMVIEGVPRYVPPVMTEEQYNKITDQIKDHFDTFEREA